MKKILKFTFINLFLTILLSFFVGYSSWQINNDATHVIKDSEEEIVSPNSEDAVAYYESKFFSSVEAAVESANLEENGKTVYVIPGTDPIISRSFTINEDVTLKIPYSDETTLTEITRNLHNNGCSKIADTPTNRPTFLKNTITLSSSIKITLRGTLEVGGIAGGAGFQGGVTNGYFTQIIMKEYSSIEVDGGTLTCYGYIKEEETSKSEIICKNSGTIIAPLAIVDYPGSVLKAYSVASKTFPFDFYDIRSIQSNMVFDGTSNLKAFAVVFGTSAGTYAGYANIIGTSDAFVIPNSSASSVSWHYIPGSKTETIKDDTNRKTYITATKGAKIDKIKMNLEGYSFDSSTFDLPISSYFDFELKDGDYEVNEKTKFLPGSRLKVNSDAILTVNKKLVCYENNKPTGGSQILSCSLNNPAKLQVYGTLYLNSEFAGVIEVISANNTGIIKTSSTFIPNASTVERSASTTTFECNDLSGKILLYGQTDEKSLSSLSTYYADGSHRDGNGGKYTAELININANKEETFDESKISNIFVSGTVVEDTITLPTPTYEDDKFMFLGYYTDAEMTKSVETGEHNVASISNALDKENHKYVLYARWALANSSKVSYRVDSYLGGTTLTQGSELKTLLNSTFTAFNEDTRAVERGNVDTGRINIYEYDGWKAKVYQSDKTTLVREIDVVNNSFEFSNTNYVEEDYFVVFEPKWDTSKTCKAPSITLTTSNELGLGETGTVTAIVSNFFEDKFTYYGGFESSDKENVDAQSIQLGTYNSISGTTATYSCVFENKNTTTNDEIRHNNVEIKFGLRVSIDVDNVTYTHDYGKKENQEYIKYESSFCLLPSTKISMANGTEKEIKDVKEGELIKVFNHESGKIDVASVTFNEKEEADLHNVIHLGFEDGTDIGVISEHGFFDTTTMKYEYIREDNYIDYIGHYFVNENGDKVKLNSAYVKEEYTETYSLPSYYHLNSYSNGFLSMPGGISGLFNIFEYNENLKYDEDKYLSDISTYGLMTLEELASYGVNEEMYNAYPAKYLKVALGKGIMSEEQLKYLIKRYGKYTS